MEILITAVMILMMIVPLWRILQRAGFKGELALIALIPWFGVVVLGGLLSFHPWGEPIPPRAVQGPRPGS